MNKQKVINKVWNWIEHGNGYLHLFIVVLGGWVIINLMGGVVNDET